MARPRNASLCSVLIAQSLRNNLCRFVRLTLRNSSILSSRRAVPLRSRTWISELRVLGTPVWLEFVQSAALRPDTHLHLQNCGQMVQSVSAHMGTASATNSTRQHHWNDIVLPATHHGHPATKQQTIRNSILL